MLDGRNFEFSEHLFSGNLVANFFVTKWHLICVDITSGSRVMSV